MMHGFFSYPGFLDTGTEPIRLVGSELGEALAASAPA
jgi:hypothetical protein